MAQQPRPILIVEDEPADAYYGRFKLERMFQNPVYIVENCRAAKDFWECEKQWSEREKVPPALVLLDLRVPGTAPSVFVRERKSDKTCKEVPICILTQYPSDLTARKALEEGANMLFRKPLDEQAFRCWLEETDCKYLEWR